MAKMTELNEHIQELIKAGATLVVEDIEEHCGYTRISNVLLRNPDISELDKVVYGLIRSFAYGDKINAFPGQDRIAQYLGKRRETVNMSLNRLKKHGLIDWLRRGMGETNVYIIKKVPQEMIINYVNREAKFENQQNDKRTLASIMQNRSNSSQKPTDVSLDTHQSKSTVKSTDVCLDTHQDVSLGAHLDVSLDAHKEDKINNTSINNHSFNHSSSKNTPAGKTGQEADDDVNDDELTIEENTEAVIRVIHYVKTKLKDLLSEEDILKLQDRWAFWTSRYGEERVKYAIDRLAEQDEIINIAKWLEGPLKYPGSYPPKVGFYKKPPRSEQQKALKAEQKKKTLLRSMYS